MKLSSLIVLINKVIDMFFFFVNERKQKEREEEFKNVQEDPVDFFNNRYGPRVRDVGSDESKPETSSSDDSEASSDTRKS